MRHPHHLPPHVNHDTLADRISGMSKPGELEYTDPEHDPWTPASWVFTFSLVMCALLAFTLICLIAGIYFERWAPPLIDFIQTAPWPRLG